MQPRPVLRVVLEVGVLDEHEVAGDVLEAGADRGALPAVLGVRDDLDGAVAELGEHGVGAVVAAVVHDDELAVERQLDDPHAAQDLDDGVALVVHGHDDRELPVRDRVVRSAHRWVRAWCVARSHCSRSFRYHS